MVESSSSASPADCNFGIELTRYVSTYNVSGRPQAYRMRIEVTRYNNVDPNLFVYKRHAPDPDTEAYRDTFEAVASPLDFEELPVGNPREGDAQPYFRLAEVDLMTRNRALLDETWAAILRDRDELIRTLTYTCELSLDTVSPGGVFPAEETTPTPTPPPVVPESSSGTPAACPADTFVGLEIVKSKDPDFPEGSVLVESGIATPPDCTRTWELTGAVSGKILTIVTSMLDHTFTLSLDGVQQDTGGISDLYWGFAFYEHAPDQEYTMRFEGI